MVRAYGIELAEEPPYLPPRNRELAFLVTGYSESIDSFFAFGLFELAKRSGFFPAELVETFEPVIQEECRHILFFANWLAWRRANLRWWPRIRFELRIAAAWVYIAGLRIGLARSVGTNTKVSHQDSNFTVTGAQAVTPIKIGFLDLMQDLPAGERPATGRLRPAAVPANPHPFAGAVCARCRQTLAEPESAEAGICRRIAKSPDIVILQPTSRRRRYRQ